ncbi:hypothetical protein EGW08_004672 [Elysia chlorotica]|uniref:Uncharacterized protein n=1 Tax=Elysia chlorotica TaxID=188477 RepID=A0A433U184_ELYCH|nr:hypothetical protein EGW08_004672 [Elysia chlorotica]
MLQTYLRLISHRSLASDHDFASRELLQFFGCHPPGAQYSTHKIELWTKKGRKHKRPVFVFYLLVTVLDIQACYGHLC